MSFWRRWLGAARAAPDDVFLALRTQALGVQPADLGLPEIGGTSIHGVLMETGLDDGSATLVCLADGTVSLYTSTGGGVIGAGAHESVREACEELIDWTNGYAPDFIGACRRATRFPLPTRGAVFFYLLTTSGVYLARCSEAKLATRADPFSNLFAACHGVLTRAREASAPDTPRPPSAG